MEIIKNNNYQIKITDMGINGEGIGKIDSFTVFVENAVLNDTIEIKIIKLKKNYAYGKIINIIEKSPFRIDAKCKWFEKCGGCNLQHLNYSAQLEYKRKKVLNNLQKIGGFTDIKVEKTLGMKNNFYYRNKAQFPIGIGKDNKTKIGFYSSRSHNIIDIDNCIIQHPINKEIIKKIREFIAENNISIYNEISHSGMIRHVLMRVGFVTNEIMICIIINSLKFNYKNEIIEKFKDLPNLKSIVINYNTDKTNTILGKNIETIYGLKYITDYIGKLKFRISPLSFYQINPIQTKVLYDTALSYACLTGKETVIDAYCGIGTISLFFAQKAKKVYGIEIIKDAVEDAKVNAKVNNIENVEFITGQSGEIITQLYKNKIKADVIVVDPPRKGCETELLDVICNMLPEKVIYISCNSATLARDLKILCSENYCIKKIQPIDMFCQTSHVECVVLMSKVDKINKKYACEI